MLGWGLEKSGKGPLSKGTEQERGFQVLPRTTLRSETTDT